MEPTTLTTNGGRKGRKVAALLRFSQPTSGQGTAGSLSSMEGEGYPLQSNNVTAQFLRGHTSGLRVAKANATNPNISSALRVGNCAMA